MGQRACLRGVKTSHGCAKINNNYNKICVVFESTQGNVWICVGVGWGVLLLEECAKIKSTCWNKDGATCVFAWGVGWGEFELSYIQSNCHTYRSAHTSDSASLLHEGVSRCPSSNQLGLLHHRKHRAFLVLPVVHDNIPLQHEALA